jgi:probable rRNA maturation factor
VAADVYAADEQADLPVDVERWSALARAVLDAEGVTADAEVSLLFVDEPAIAALNGRFLDKEGPTDVLATNERGTDQLLLLGDVVICPVVAARHAVEHEVPVEDELALLVVHGILHLLGMDHVLTHEAERMEERERQLLARFHQSSR